MIKIDSSLLNEVSDRASTVPRKRTNHNFHQQSDDKLQRMLNAMEPGTYIRPHKHINPVKREAFVILTGKILFIEFSDEGKITNHFILNRELGHFGLEITPKVYHSLISLEKGSVVYEIKDGPYDPSLDKDFAPWSPEEGAPEADEFTKRILAELKIQL